MPRKQPRSTVLPEILGKRSELDHAMYATGEQAYDLFSVSIAIGTGDKRHVVNAPTGNDEVSRRLRRYALALSRFALPNASITKRAKVAKVREQTVKSAIRAMAQTTYRHAFNDDPTKGTLNTTMLASALTGVMTGRSDDMDSVVTALSLTGTGAFDDIMAVLRSSAKVAQDTAFCDYLDEHGARILDHWLDKGSIKNYEHINAAKNTWQRRNGLRNYDHLARVMERLAQNAMRQARRDRVGPNGRPRDGSPQRRERIAHVQPSEKWETLRVAKPDLTVSHTGKLGRKVIRGQEGKYPHYIDRLVTDPERRIFRRKTRSLGAVLVLDCSGSMGWSEEDIDRVIQVSSGATILCYSARLNDDSYDGPNAWVVAKRNQRVRRLPDFPGGNGVDGPALMYAIKNLRNSSVNPVIWVSDQQVTGKGDVCSSELRRETNAIVRRYGVHVVPDADAAVRLVRKLQGK